MFKSIILKLSELIQDQAGKLSGLRLATSLGAVPMVLITPVVFAILSFKAGKMVQIDPSISLYLGTLFGAHIGHKFSENQNKGDAS